MSLRVRKVSDIPTPPPIEWVWENRIARGYITMLGGTGGVGKSSLIASLEVAVVAGLPFLDGSTLQGPVLHADFDTDERAQLPWLERAITGQRVSSRVLNDISYIDSEDGGYMDEAGLADIRAHAIEKNAVLIVIDAFTSAFPLIRGNDAGEVMQVMSAFRQLAKDTNAAVVILDHAPKPIANVAEGRGLLGSTIKSAGARAVHLVTRVPTKETGGLDILHFQAHKNNLAPVGEPLGIQRIWAGNGLRFEPYVLSGNDHDLPVTKARRVLEDYLHKQAGSSVPRREVFEHLMTRTGVSDRTVKRVVAEALSENTIQVVELGGRGNPVAYKSVLDVAEPGPLDDLALSSAAASTVAPNDYYVSDGIVPGTDCGPKSESGPKSRAEGQDILGKLVI